MMDANFAYPAMNSKFFLQFICDQKHVQLIASKPANYVMMALLDIVVQSFAFQLHQETSP